MTAALSVTLMLVMGLTGISTYAAPMLAALMLIPVRQRYGIPTALTVWLAAGLLSLLLVTDRELSLLYLTIYGWYPVLRPKLMEFPRLVSIFLRYALFNGCFFLTYALLLSLLGIDSNPFSMSWIMVLFLLMMNVTFLWRIAFLSQDWSRYDLNFDGDSYKVGC